MRSYDVIVIGVGGMGSAAVFELACRGHKVLGLEQFPLVHDRGSSHGQTRIIRTAYFEHPNYVPLVRRSFARWYDLEQRAGRHLLTECGLLNIGQPGSEIINGVQQAAREHNLETETLSAGDMRRRYPQFRFGDDYVGVMERQAGWLHVEECVRAHIEQAQVLGAEIHGNEPVLHWQALANEVIVRTAQETYHAQKLVITAGAWASRVLADLGLPLTVTRKVLLWFAPNDPGKFRRDVFPIYLISAAGGYFYGFPMIDAQGHKTARHDLGDVVSDPAQVERGLKPDDESDVRRFLAEHLPEANGSLRAHKVCLYTLTPDQHFIIDVHPHHPRVCLAAGFSGHGFKFASAVGECLADLAEDNRTALPIAMFNVQRFRCQ